MRKNENVRTIRKKEVYLIVVVISTLTIELNSVNVFLHRELGGEVVYTGEP